jgi:1,4-dihydroxy-6-naphthoate synthase
MSNQDSYTLAYSPCPNDTFLFYNLVHNKLNLSFGIQEELHDVEELNRSAKLGKFDITKLSFAAFFQVASEYEILESGSALGRGCGPILIAKKGIRKKALGESKILIPGEMTTANLLLNLYAQESGLGILHSVPIRYDRIIPTLNKGEADYGLIIHEERFTYSQFDLDPVVDLGDWWETLTGFPIPLGCIAVRKSLPKEKKEEISRAIQASLDMAWRHPEEPQEYILQNSQNKDLGVVRSHIDLYVNEFTYALGDQGKKAIQELFDRYRKVS